MGIKMQNKGLTIHLTVTTVNKMKKYPEVNWSVIARLAFEAYIKEREKSTATVFSLTKTDEPLTHPSKLQKTKDEEKVPEEIISE